MITSNNKSVYSFNQRDDRWQREPVDVIISRDDSMSREVFVQFIKRQTVTVHHFFSPSLDLDTLAPFPPPRQTVWHTASHATRDSWLWQSLPHHAAVDEGKGRRWDEPPNRQLTAHFSLSVCLLSWLAELWPDWSVLRRVTIIEVLSQRSVFLRTSGSFNP